MGATRRGVSVRGWRVFFFLKRPQAQRFERLCQRRQFGIRDPRSVVLSRRRFWRTLFPRLLLLVRLRFLPRLSSFDVYLSLYGQ
jgi:hypothetical protein